MKPETRFVCGSILPQSQMSRPLSGHRKQPSQLFSRTMLCLLWSSCFWTNHLTEWLNDSRHAKRQSLDTTCRKGHWTNQWIQKNRFTGMNQNQQLRTQHKVCVCVHVYMGFKLNIYSSVSQKYSVYMQTVVIRWESSDSDGIAWNDSSGIAKQTSIQTSTAALTNHDRWLQNPQHAHVLRHPHTYTPRMTYE